MRYLYLIIVGVLVLLSTLVYNYKNSDAQGVSAKFIAVLADSTGALITSLNGLAVRLVETIAGEDVGLDLIKVEERYVFVNITTNTTTLVKIGPGKLHSIVINTGLATGVIRCRDNTVDAGTTIGTVTQPSVLLESQKMLIYDVVFSVGLVCITSVAAQDFTIVYR